MRVLDDDAEDVATGTALENETITVALPDGLADGTYTVVFEVISVDSHRIAGASVFHVGVPLSQGLTADAIDLGGDEAGWGVRVGAAILSAIAYAGALVAAGTFCFSLYAEACRAARGDQPCSRTRCRRPRRRHALPHRSPRRRSRRLRNNEILTSALRGPIGVSTVVTALAFLVVAVLIDRRLPRCGSPALTLVALGRFLHRRTHQDAGARWAIVASDVVHLVAACGLARRHRRPRPRLPHDRAMPARSPRAVRRFSDVALIAVGILP